MTRRLFLKRASVAVGVIVFLPAAKSIGQITSRGEGYYEHTILAMGTTARIGVYARSEEEANAIISEAFAELKRLESLFTIFDPKSEISQLNASAGKLAVTCSIDTIAILQAAKNYSKLTDSAFDVTVEPLMRLWGFRAETNTLARVPSAEEVREVLQVVGSDQITFTDNAVQLRSIGAKIDLGGVAVGFALDRMADILRARGIEHAFIDISGDMLALGHPKGKQGWDVGIPDPQDPTKLFYHTAISNEALATSGNYMSYMTYRSRRYGHIIDPAVGEPAHQLLSSTVIAKTGVDADALSTASFVAGKQFGDTKLIAVDRNGHVKVS
jgi:thiamine biosynthesis lipoprotein